MIGFRHGIAGIMIWSMCGWSSLAAAQAVPYEDRYAQEQALVIQLSASNAAQDQRRLADLLRDGLMAGADNPLRRSDRDGAISAYRRAISLGDQSPGTFAALARVLLRENDASGMADMRPMLRNLMLNGSGDAAYVLALDAAQNQKASNEEIVKKLEAAAVMGSIWAVMDLVAGGANVGETIRTASLHALEQRALDGGGTAAYALHQTYEEGRLVERAPETAMKWLRLAADQGSVTAIEHLAIHLLHGLDAAPDKAAAAALYRDAADAGSGTSAMALGRSLTTGPDMGISIDEGRLWLRRAAEINYPEAAAELANLDLNMALKSRDDPAERASKIESALAPVAQDPDALASLANRHWKTSASDAIAPALMPLLEAQALLGSPTAGLAYNAWLQVRGKALPVNVAIALVNALKKTPVTSKAFSTFLIADLALEGRIPEDIIPRSTAFNLLLESADAKVGQAMFRLGKLYQQGDQLPRNMAFAKRWLVQASALAVERAAWDLAAIQLADDDETERAEGERFYLERLDEGDIRAGLALVRYRLQTGVLDVSTLAQVRRAARQPIDLVELAEILVASGSGENIRTARQMLSAIPEEQFDPRALVSYGRLLMMTASSDAENDHGMRLLVKAADTGIAAAKTALASTYLSSLSYRDKQAHALHLLNDVLAENPHDQDARLLMSKAYLMGLGTKRDARKASELIEDIRAEGEFGNPKATLLAADWLAFSAADRNPVAAVSLLRAQAARGSISADRELGESYLSGFGPSVDPDIAASHLYEAAKAGDKEAMASLGHLFLNGYGVNKSRDTGLAWLKRAAEAGNTAAMYELSRIFALDPAAELEEDQVVYWLNRAANRNHPNASYQLGLAYLKGEWVPHDLNDAARWFERSAASGNLLAARTLEDVRRQIASVAEVPVLDAPE